MDFKKMEMLTQSYKDYFLNTNDTNAHFFEISESPYPSFCYKESIVFGKGEHKIHIIDQFSGKRPALFNHQYCTSGTLDLKFWCSVTLDSNVVSLLHEFVTAPERMDAPKFDSTKSFLLHLAKANCDFNPLFYVIESYCKSSDDDFNTYVPKTLASILKLLTMCEKSFIEEGLIRSKNDAMKHYFNLYDAKDFEECGVNWTAKIVKDIIKINAPKKINLIYACLLKMVLIKFIDNKGVYDKSERFERFMMDELGIRMARESSLALYYFCNLAGKFINTQSNMALEDAIHDLKATAWDLYLLTFPEQLLTPRFLPEVNTSYVATSEVKLYEIGKLFDINLLACRTDDNGMGIPAISFNMKAIEEKIGDEAVMKLIKRNEKISFERVAMPPVTSIQPVKLDELIKNLEDQLTNLCNKRP